MDEVQTPAPLRIAHVITRLINGGADENTVISCNQAVRAGHEVILIHGAQTHPEILAKVDARVRREALPTLVRPLAPFSDAWVLRELTQIFRALKPDIVHTHTSKVGILGRLAARAAGVPKIVHGVHIAPFANVSSIERLIYLAAEKTVEGMTHAFIDVSCGMRDLYIEAGLGDAGRHHVIPSGFDLASFRNACPPEDWRELIRLSPEEPRPPVLLMIAALEPRKRHLEFLEVFPSVVSCSPNVKLLLAGEGKLRSQIESRIERLGIRQNVILTGFRADPERLIALADICLLTSMREGLPRVVVQYLAGGKPCIVNDLPGLDQVLRHGENGVVVPSNDMANFAVAIITLLKDKAKRACLAQAAADTNLWDWDEEQMGERIEIVYRHLMRERRGLSTCKASKTSVS